MTGIVSMRRDAVGNVNIVRIETEDTLATVQGSTYLTDQATNIANVNEGAFEWQDTDTVLVYCTDGWGFYSVNAGKTAFVALFPTIVGAVTANHIAVFLNAGGNIGDDVATAINGGNIQAGLSGTAGFLSSFPATAASGELRLEAATNAGGDFDTTIRNATSVGQNQVISIPDSGQATSEFIIADSAGIQHVTSGSLQVDAGFLASGLAAGGFIGRIDAYPTTAANGRLSLVAANNAGGDFDTVISNAGSVGQDQVISIPDSGQATSEFIIADSAGTQNITSGALQVDAGAVSSGLAAGGFIGRFDAYPTTATNGRLSLLAANNGAGDFDTAISNATSVGQDQVVSIPDSGAATANFLLDTGAANILAKQMFLGLGDVLTFGTGTWTVTRIAQGNYVSRHTPGDETSIIAIDITPAIRVAASKGFRLDSFDVIYAIAANPLDAHTVVLDRIEYANNVAVSVNSVAITGTLATATQANPYVTNVAVDAPAFDVTADSKYVVELTVNNAAASEYDYYGLMLRFSETIG